MGYTNLGTLLKINEQQKSLSQQNGYIKIANLNVDFRKLKKMTNNEYQEMIFANDTSRANCLEDSLAKFCIEMHMNNIPFTGIEVTGHPGIIAKCTFHEKFMKEFMRSNIHNSHVIIHWNDVYSRNYMKSLKMDDVKVGYVPIEFTFRPTIKLKDDSTHRDRIEDSFERLGIEPIQFVHQDIVLYDDFIRELNNDGYHLMFKGIEPKTYEEYFNWIRNSYPYEKMEMNVDLTNDTNVSMLK